MYNTVNSRPKLMNYLNSINYKFIIYSTIINLFKLIVYLNKS